jgi:hypothetical protein
MSESYALIDPNLGVPSARSTRVKVLFDYWNRVRADRPFPTRADIDPMALKPILPHVMMTEISYDPFRVLYRLVGTEIVRFAKLDFTNRYADELEFQDVAENDWSAFYRKVVDARRPGFGITSWTIEGGLTRWIEFLICPLSDDGVTINRCIAVEDYENLDPLQIDSLPPVSVR